MPAKETKGAISLQMLPHRVDYFNLKRQNTWKQNTFYFYSVLHIHIQSTEHVTRNAREGLVVTVSMTTLQKVCSPNPRHLIHTTIISTTTVPTTNNHDLLSYFVSLTFSLTISASENKVCY